MRIAIEHKTSESKAESEKQLTRPLQGKTKNKKYIYYQKVVKQQGGDKHPDKASGTPS